MTTLIMEISKFFARIYCTQQSDQFQIAQNSG